MNGHSTIVLDLLFGDGAKGKVSNWIAYQNDYDIAVRAGTGTNAGASAYFNNKIIKTNQFPLCGIFPTKSGKIMTLMVGSGVSVDPVKALREINEYNMKNYHVDELCTVITQEHKNEEANGENYSESHTGSTKSGTGASKLSRVRRDTGILVKDNVELAKQLNAINISKFINKQYDDGKKIMIAGSQGYHLSLYCSYFFPVVTSANCTATAFADNVGLSWNRIDEVCAIVKSAPTMVAQGCGVLPGEISKEEIAKLNIQEFGVTTGRPRRKSLTIPFDLLEEAVLVNSPTFFALTFCDHVDKFEQRLPEIVKLEDLKIFPKTYSNILELQKRFNIPVKYIEYGKEWNYISEVRG